MFWEGRFYHFLFLGLIEVDGITQRLIFDRIRMILSGINQSTKVLLYAILISHGLAKCGYFCQ